ncbi:MAG TPA: DUF4231 domain-containing protein [Ktedonobacteraceae bacterium]|nr:DUF4231 domain-containing protein [Ktedonobacteraceae bacterium]
MDEDLQSTGMLQNDKRFLSVLEEVTRIKEEFVGRQLNWYKANARRPMLLFRIAGVLVILLSVSLPFLTTLDGLWKTIVLPVVSLLIAGLTGLNSFFRWESNWKGYRQTHLTLEYLLTMWELQIAEAKCQVDVQKGIDIALKATEQLISATQTTVSAEAEEYFKRVQVAQTQQS